VKSEPIEIRFADLWVILERLCGSDTMKRKRKELSANDMVRLEVLARRRLRVTIRATGEIFEMGK
jgi:hypothetical protein